MTRTTRARVKLTAGLLASLALVGSASACASSEAAGANGKNATTIRYQSSAGSVDPLLVADALGDLKGLTLKRVGDVTGGPQALQALASNQTDIAASAFYGAIAQLVASGAKIKAVIPTYGSDAKTFGQVVVPADSTIKSASIAQSRGRWISPRWPTDWAFFSSPRQSLSYRNFQPRTASLSPDWSSFAGSLSIGSGLAENAVLVMSGGPTST